MININANINIVRHSGGGAQAFSPLDFPDGLQAYHNVLDLSTQYANGAQVTLMDDLSENGKTLTNTGTGTGPIWQADHGDGYPAIACDGTRVFVCQTGKSDWDFMHQDSSTAMYLVKSTVDNANHILYSSMGIGNNANGRFDIFRQFSPGGGGQNGSFETRIRNSSATSVACVLPEEKAPKDEWLLIWVVVDRTAGFCDVYVNGLLQQRTALNVTWSTNTSTDPPGLLGYRQNTSNRFNGYYRTSAFWNIALSPEVIAKISGGKSFPIAA